MLRDYQILAFNKLIENDKSFIFWPRAKGKTYLIHSFIDYFVKNNNDQEIIIFVNDGRRTPDIMKKIRIFLDNAGSVQSGKKLINNNNITIISILSNCYSEALRSKNPSLIIFDEFAINNLNNLGELSNYINNFNCKTIFTASYINTIAIKTLDRKNDFYINIKRISDDDLYNYYRFKNYDYDSLIKNILSYKSDKLLDFDDTIYQRRKKLQALNKISNGI